MGTENHLAESEANGFLVVDPGPDSTPVPTNVSAYKPLTINDDASLLFDSLVRSDDAEIAARMLVRCRDVVLFLVFCGDGMFFDAGHALIRIETSVL